MISSIYVKYLNYRHENYTVKKILKNWKKKKKTIKKQYFRKYQVKVWLHKSKRVLLRPYLINQNLWYSAKKGLLLNLYLYKISNNITINNNPKMTFKSLVIDYNKKV